MELSIRVCSDVVLASLYPFGDTKERFRLDCGCSFDQHMEKIKIASIRYFICIFFSDFVHDSDGFVKVQVYATISISTHIRFFSLPLKVYGYVSFLHWYNYLIMHTWCSAKCQTQKVVHQLQVFNFDSSNHDSRPPLGLFWPMLCSL